MFDFAMMIAAQRGLLTHPEVLLAHGLLAPILGAIDCRDNE